MQSNKRSCNLQASGSGRKPEARMVAASNAEAPFTGRGRAERMALALSKVIHHEFQILLDVSKICLCIPTFRPSLIDCKPPFFQQLSESYH
ncbi:MAG: hypothetical protein EZS28_010754 [Streblomastix strix]|uniref:Uncharacterized protein n=1 Tax=Streblomastix strix TaxID=222440 RepID=A0A5J4WFR9_9EUKA|nr:MAG: hypothetical protein EZS28_010754 [Streblomastix strix]